MAEIITYKPTESLGASERTQSGYYGAIKSWVQGLSDVFTKWFDITYTDDTFTILFTPKDTDIARFTFDIVVASSGVKLGGCFGNSKEYKNFNGFNKDIAFYIYDSNSGFFVGADVNKIIYAVVSATAFGSNTKKQTVLIVGNSMTYICVSGATYAYTISGDYNKVSGGITDVYRIQSMPVNGTDIVFDSVYYFDGGMSDPPSGVFKVGSDSYCTITKNVCVKL